MGGIWFSWWVKPWIGLLSKGTDILTTSVVVIFRAKVSCDTLISWQHYMIQHTLTLNMLPQRLSKCPSVTLNNSRIQDLLSQMITFHPLMKWLLGENLQCVKMMHFVSNSLSASVDHLRRSLVLITKFIHLVMKAFDHWCIVFNVFFNDLLRIKSFTDY